MADNDVAVKVKAVYKDFKLPHERTNSLKSLVTGVHKKRDKGFEVQHALKDISFEIKKGEFFGIVGRNGSGKSTLLKIIAEIYRPTKGTVTKHGKLVPFIELGVGFNPELTGRENVFLNGALLGFSQEEVEAMYDEIVEFAELERFMDQKLKNYSSGMQVRLAFSVATRAKADILLIDEVLAVGDADFQRKCFEYFKLLKKKKTTVIFISHDMNAVREYCDRAVLIDNSQLISEGAADQIASEYTQLFTSVTSEEGTQPSNKRWGKSVGLIEKVVIPSALKHTDPVLNIDIFVEPVAKLDNPVIGYVVKDIMGQSVTGSNTRMIQVKPSKYKSGESFTAAWDIPNIFSDGRYTLDVAILADDGVTVLDWWETCAKFRVFEDIPSIYPVSPKVSLHINKRK